MLFGLTIGTERAAALQQSIQDELTKRGYSPDADSVMAKSITIMVINNKTAAQITSELEDLIGSDYKPSFTDWLFEEAAKGVSGPEIALSPPPTIEQAIEPEPSREATSNNVKDSSRTTPGASRNEVYQQAITQALPPTSTSARKRTSHARSPSPSSTSAQKRTSARSPSPSSTSARRRTASARSPSRSSTSAQKRRASARSPSPPSTSAQKRRAPARSPSPSTSSRPSKSRRNELPVAPRAKNRDANSNSLPVSHTMEMWELTFNNRVGGKVRVKCSPDDSIEDLKKLVGAQLGTHPSKIRFMQWYREIRHHPGLAVKDVFVNGQSVELY